MKTSKIPCTLPLEMSLDSLSVLTGDHLKADGLSVQPKSNISGQVFKTWTGWRWGSLHHDGGKTWPLGTSMLPGFLLPAQASGAYQHFCSHVHICISPLSRSSMALRWSSMTSIPSLWAHTTYQPFVSQCFHKWGWQDGGELWDLERRGLEWFNTDHVYNFQFQASL